MAEQHSQTSDYENRWKFTGHELDKETGLYYAGARYYHPKISIWLSVDRSDVVTSALNNSRSKDGKKVKNGEFNFPTVPDFWNEYPNNKHDRIKERNKDIGSYYWDFEAVYPKNRKQFDYDGLEIK